MSDTKDGDDTVEIRGLKSAAQLLDGPQAYSAPERGWLKWFYSFSEEDQRIVEICGEKGISVKPANFDQMKKLVKEHDAEDSGSHE